MSFNIKTEMHMIKSIREIFSYEPTYAYAGRLKNIGRNFSMPAVQ